MSDFFPASKRPALVTAEDSPYPADGACVLPAPMDVAARYPASDRVKALVSESRRAVRAVLTGEDDRLLLITGPCSIHDAASAKDYAGRLAALAADVSDVILPVMRVYVEKPRTSVGWTGWLNDPGLDGSCRTLEGLIKTRELMLAINETGVPVASEALSPFVPQYLQDLVSWMCIGARTVESPVHREMAGELPMPVGFKNSTEGAVEPAIDAMKIAARARDRLGVGPDGRVRVIATAGNADGHLVLRGGRTNENWMPEKVLWASSLAAQGGLRSRVIVDCAHGNSHKDVTRAKAIFETLIDGIVADARLRRALGGLMLESHLIEGSQLTPFDRAEKGLAPVPMIYGCSVTDACVGWEATERLVRLAAGKLRRCRLRDKPAAA